MKFAEERLEEAVRSANKLLEKVSVEAGQVGSAIEDRLEKERGEDTSVVIAQHRLLELGELPEGAK